MLAVGAFGSEVRFRAADGACHNASIPSTRVCSPAFAFAERPSFTFALALATKEHLVILLVCQAVEEGKPGFSFAFSFFATLAFEKLSYLASWSAHVLAPVLLGMLVCPKQVFINLVR